ncbi:MAG TPA: presqualene diphosphate synthase HpnD [Rhizomicrobium sp.]|jgi:phytoene synthase|nr:presqualene diphosphate synthase HpnD [Rhizomicrobium sp.]
MTDTGPETARRTASGSSFYWGMRLLPREKREAMYAIYAFCRAVDDIADDVTTPDANRATQLGLWRDAIISLFRGEPSDRTDFLKPHIQNFALRQADFLSVIEGMEMDASGAMIAPDLQTLDYYCDCVASAVGRLSIKVFGMQETPGFRLAHHLGRALQLTNILRDLDEDAGLGRLYLPREFLGRAAIALDTPARAIAHPVVDSVCRSLAELAEHHYREAEVIFHSRPGGDLRPSRLMGALYSAMLARMKNRGWSAPRQSTRISKPVLIWLVLRHGFAA